MFAAHTPRLVHGMPDAMQNPVTPMATPHQSNALSGISADVRNVTQPAVAESYPNQVERLICEGQAIQPGNTNRDYKKIQEEFVFWAQNEYGNADVDENKLFGFMFYTSYRKLRSPRSWKMQRDLMNDFHSTLRRHELPPERPNSENDFVFANPGNQKYIGISTFDKTISAVKELATLAAMRRAGRHLSTATAHDRQITTRHLSSARLDFLAKHVQRRATHLAVLDFKEKLQPKDLAFHMIPHISKIEELFWQSTAGQAIKPAMAGLRNRFFYLFSLSGFAARGYNIEKSKLSDFHDLMMEKPDFGDPTPVYHVLRLTMLITKATRGGGKAVVASLLRALKPEMCGVGAFALYLMARFFISQEDEDLDFSRNEEWFNINLMVSQHVTSHTNDKEPIKNRQYDQALRRIFNQLNIPFRHTIHFGRSEGPTILSWKEARDESSEVHGAWHRTNSAFDKAYHSGIDWGALRLASGHPEEKGRHFNPRTHCMPPESLSKQVFPFVDEQLAKVQQLMASDSSRRQLGSSGSHLSTAFYFLQMMKNMRHVVLQDAAVLILNGRRHTLFDMHPVFQSSEFADFVELMRAHLRDVEVGRRPFHDQMNSLAPGIGTQMHAYQQQNHMLSGQVQRLGSHFDARLTQMDRRLVQIEHMQMRQSSIFCDTINYNFQRLGCHFAEFRMEPLPGSSAGTSVADDGYGEPKSPPDASDASHFCQTVPATQTIQRLSQDVEDATVQRPNLQLPQQWPRQLAKDTIADIYKLWVGSSGSFFEQHGGLKGLERDHRGWMSQNKWSQGDKKIVSRIKNVALAIEAKAEYYAIKQDSTSEQSLDVAMQYYEALRRSDEYKDSTKTLSGIARFFSKAKALRQLEEPEPDDST